MVIINSYSTFQVSFAVSHFQQPWLLWLTTRRSLNSLPVGKITKPTWKLLSRLNVAGHSRSTEITSNVGHRHAGTIWDVSKHELIFWRGTKLLGWGSRGVYLIPYTDRFHELQFSGPLWGGTPGAPKSKIKIRANFVVLPKNPQHNNILNIAWTTEQLNLELKKNWMGHKNSWGRRNYLGAMTQAHRCVTLR